MRDFALRPTRLLGLPPAALVLLAVGLATRLAWALLHHVAPVDDFLEYDQLARSVAFHDYYGIDGIATTTPDSVAAIIGRHKVGDVVQLDVEQKKIRRKVPMTIRGRRSMKVSTYESLSLPLTPQIVEFRKNWLDSKRGSKL